MNVSEVVAWAEEYNDSLLANDPRFDGCNTQRWLSTLKHMLAKHHDPHRDEVVRFRRFTPIGTEAVK
jgi:hypothetical protein